MPTLTNQQLHKLIKPVLPFASKDDFLPMLNAVRLDPLDGKLSAVATDRYRLGRTKLSDVEADGFAATIPIATARWLLTVFKASQKGNEITLDLNDDGTVRISGATVWGPRIELNVDQAPGDYPKLAPLFTEAEDRAATGSATFNGNYLADIGNVVAGSMVAYMTVELSDIAQRKPVLFTHEGDGAAFTGLLMPVRMPRREDDI